MAGHIEDLDARKIFDHLTLIESGISAVLARINEFDFAQPKEWQRFTEQLQAIDSTVAVSAYNSVQDSLVLPEPGLGEVYLRPLLTRVQTDLLMASTPGNPSSSPERYLHRSIKDLGKVRETLLHHFPHL